MRTDAPSLPKRILVIEDVAGIADFIERGLGALGYAVTLAADGIDGQRRALTEAVDLIVLDLMLPGRDGLEVLAAVRAAKPSLPVIILSARPRTETQIRDIGANDYLAKPFALADLLTRIRVQLQLQPPA